MPSITKLNFIMSNDHFKLLALFFRSPNRTIFLYLLLEENMVSLSSRIASLKIGYCSFHNCDLL